MSVFIAEIKNEKLKFGSDFNRSRFVQFLKENDGKKVRIEKIQPKRGLSLNSRYWAYLNDIERETGNNAEYLHEICKRKFLSPKWAMITINGKEVEMKIPSSTTDLTSSEFIDYMDKIVAWTNIPQKTREELGYLPN